MSLPESRASARPIDPAPLRALARLTSPDLVDARFGRGIAEAVEAAFRAEVARVEAEWLRDAAEARP